MSLVNVYEKEIGKKVFTRQYQNDRGESVAVHKVAYVRWLELKVTELEEELAHLDSIGGEL